jgi:ATP-dependent DNA helicase PIF1
MDISTLSQEQHYAYNKFTQNENMFITGQGGTGKTRLIEYLVQNSKERGKTVQVCALTGCATILLPKSCNARTIHSWSGIRLCKGPNKSIVENAIRNKRIKSAWRKTRILIVDEVSMMSIKMFEVLDNIAQVANGNNKPFGGIQMVFVGDFFQLPPVGTAGDADTERFCFESRIWNRVFPANNHIELKTVFRQIDPLYKEILSQIRTATLTEENIQLLEGNVKRPYDSTKYNGCVPPKLYPTRAKADYLNNLMYSKLDGNSYEFECIKKTTCKTFIESNKPLSIKNLERGSELSTSEIEYELQQLINTSSLQETLCLKEGTVVMCTANICVSSNNGICNGSQGIVLRIIESEKGNAPLIKFTNGIERVMNPHYVQSDEYPTIAIGQIPLRLSWAMTIHKIQGATLPMANIDVGGQIFEYGQTYVALSRVESLDGLYLSAFHAHKIRANQTVIDFYSKMKKQDYTIVVPEIVELDGKNPFIKYEFNELEEDEYNIDPTIKRIIL